MIGTRGGEERFVTPSDRSTSKRPKRLKPSDPLEEMLSTAGLLLLAAWHPPLPTSPPSPSSSRRAARAIPSPAARLKNADSSAAESFEPRKLRRDDASDRSPSASYAKKKIRPDEPDVRSPTETFDALCRMCGVPAARSARLDFDGFVLAFEQLLCRGVQLDPEAVDELRQAVGSGDEVSMASWDLFHKSWLQASTMESHLLSAVEKRRAAEEEKKRAEESARREQEWEQRLVKAKEEATQKAISTPRLLAQEAEKKKQSRGKWFEERESAALAAAQYRSLDPAKWTMVTEGVGGLSSALEEIRRRIWVPLCAPRQLLDERELRR